MTLAPTSVTLGPSWHVCQTDLGEGVERVR
jgi:hypothetical protein